MMAAVCIAHTVGLFEIASSLLLQSQDLTLFIRVVCIMEVQIHAGDLMSLTH